MKKTLTPVATSHAKILVEVSLPVLASIETLHRGLNTLFVEVGMQAFEALQEQDRNEQCGPKHSRNPDRKAVRGGSVSSEVTLGGRRVRVRRLRAATLDGQELALPSFIWASKRDPLDDQTLQAMIAGVSSRKYGDVLDPLVEGMEERSTSKSSFSRRFVALSQKKLTECLSRSLEELNLWVVMMDGIEYRDRTILIALGIDQAGNKHVLGLREGTTENAAVVRALLTDLVDRGLSTDHPLLFVIDGAKALRKAIKQVFAKSGVVQRCQVHKIRNVLGHLPAHMRPSVRRAMNQAYDASCPKLARRQLERLANSLEQKYPGAAGSLWEGLEETLTLQKLGITGALRKTLRSTNSIENLNGGVAQFTRNVRRWQGGSMVLRWVGTAILEAEKKFRRIRGHKAMDMLRRSLLRLVDAEENITASKTA